MESYYGPDGPGWNNSPLMIAAEEVTEDEGEGSGSAVPPMFPADWENVVKMEVKDELEELVDSVSCFLT